MKITIKATNIKLTPSIRQNIEEQINSLERFSKIFQKKEEYFDHFFGKGPPRVEAWVEVGKTTLHHKKGPFFRAECQMRFPGYSVRAEATSKYLKAAITEVKDELQRQLKQYKQKPVAKIRRGQRMLKRLVRFARGAQFKRKKGGRVRHEGM